ncbi:MAG: flavin monoamine oxidase family protein [Kofleriaceae bacterium]
MAIVGGGLSGVYAAALLEARGIHDYVLLEARETFGGRILSVPSVAADPFDLGGTWYWPGWQPELDRLIRELGLETFEQHAAGDTLIDSSPHRAPSRVPGIASSPPSLRLAGGMGSLVDAIRGRLVSTRLLRDQRVRRIHQAGLEVTLDAEDSRGRTTSYRAAHVLLAVPPRLAATTIELTPALPDALRREWQHTGTWMARHAKYVAIYDEAFWREQGLSGEARSTLGPLAEIHDASTPRGDAALFGFFGVPSQTRAHVSEDVLRSHCRAQLARLFGSRAAAPKLELLKDWARDPYTATAADLHALTDHPVAPSPAATAGVWRDRVTGIASEWSPRFPGYIAGAVDAAIRGVTAFASRT